MFGPIAVKSLVALSIVVLSKLAYGSDIPAFEIIAPNGKRSILLGTMHTAHENLRQPSGSVLKGYSKLIIESDAGQATTSKPDKLSDQVIDGGIESLVIGQPIRAPWTQQLTEKQISQLRANFYCLPKIADSDPQRTFDFILMQKSARFASDIALYPCSGGQKSRDEILYFAAKELNLKIVTLESQNEVESLRQRVPESYRQAVLSTVLSDDHDIDVQRCVSAINTGDWDTVYKIGVGDLNKPGYAEFDKLMIKERNRRWIPRLTRLLNEGNVFVLVGGAHISTDQGIVALLRKRGFVIRPTTI